MKNTHKVINLDDSKPKSIKFLNKLQVINKKIFQHHTNEFILIDINFSHLIFVFILLLHFQSEFHSIVEQSGDFYLCFMIHKS